MTRFLKKLKSVFDLSIRFGWLGHVNQKSKILKLYYLFFGIPFLHTQVIARYVFKKNISLMNKKILDMGTGDGVFAH